MKKNSDQSPTLRIVRPAMKLKFGTVAVVLKDKTSHEALLLEHIASCCEYDNKTFYDTRKGACAFMLRRTGIKHNNSYVRAAKKLIDLGLIIKLSTALGRSSAIYMLTEESVEIAREGGFKTRTQNVRLTRLGKKINIATPVKSTQKSTL